MNLYNLGCGSGSEAQETETKTDSIKIKNLCVQRCYQEMENNSQTGRKYFQITYLRKIWYPDYIQNLHNSTTETQPNLKMNQELE